MALYVLTSDDDVKGPEFADEAWNSVILHYLLDNKKTQVTMLEVHTMCLMMPLGQINQVSERRVSKILSHLGCTRWRRPVGGKSEHVYRIPVSVFKE